MSINNIRMAILSADNRCVGHLDNSTESGLHYFKDSFVDYLEGAAGVFTFSAPAGHPESQHLVEGNKIAFVYQNKDRYYTIVKAAPSEHTIDVTAYSLCLDLINEQSPAYEAAQAMTFAQYLAVFCDEDYLTINRNEVDGVAIKHTWDGTSTLLARLYSLATVFSAELEFLPILRADYTLERIEVNVYAQHDETHQGIGEARQDIVMQYGVNVRGIRKTSDITGLYTSIYATGKDGITISDIARTVTDSDGDVLYFTEAGSPVLYAKQARDRYPSSISEDGGYIQYSPGQATDYETAEALYGYMLGRLKVISQPAVSYEVDGYDALNVGDTVIIKDEEFQPPLYLAARVSQQNICLTDPTKNQTIFDNFTEMVSQVKEIDTGLKKGEDAVLLRIDSSRGLLFKNNMVSTVLSVSIYSGSERITNSADLRRVFGNSARLEWYWQRLNDDAYGVISAADSRLSDNGFHFTLTPDDVDTKVTFMCQLLLD